MGAARIVDGTVGALYSTENSLQEAIVEWARYRRVPPIGQLRDEPFRAGGFGLAQIKEEGTTHKEFWTLHDFMFAVPNGVQIAGNPGRRARYMNAMKNRGLKPGVSDLIIAYPVAPLHGMYLELKLQEKSKVRDPQIAWKHLMSAVGYYAVIATGFNDAVWHVENYLRGSYEAHPPG